MSQVGVKGERASTEDPTISALRSLFLSAGAQGLNVRDAATGQQSFNIDHLAYLPRNIRGRLVWAPGVKDRITVEFKRLDG